MAEMTRAEIVAECKRLKRAINTTNSEKLRKDYGKRLKSSKRGFCILRGELTCGKR